MPAHPGHHKHGAISDPLTKALVGEVKARRREAIADFCCECGGRLHAGERHGGLCRSCEDGHGDE